LTVVFVCSYTRILAPPERSTIFKTTMKIFYAMFFLLAPVGLFAYLDPGTGSLLLYALVGVAASLIFALRNLWYRVRELFFAGRLRGKESNEAAEIVFHSEGGRYWQVFEPILAALETRGIDSVYVTPDPKDPAIAWARERSHLRAINPGNELMTIAWMNRLKARLVVSTTPNLDVYMWKRSPRAGRYLHLFHAPTTVEFYEKYALCFYDDILTVGPFQEKAIAELDRKRGLPAKRLYPVGLTYYDFMLRELRSLEAEGPAGGGEAATAERSGKGSILYAPSWGSRSSLVLFGRDLVGQLLSCGYRVVLRPHPQSALSDREILSGILGAFGPNPLFSVDRNLTAIRAMSDSDFMVTDFSGVMFDYAYLFGKPIILAALETPVTGGYEAEDVDGPLWDVESARRLSRPLPDDLGELPALVEEIMRDRERLMAGNLRFRDETVMNFGRAGEAVADCLENLLGGQG